MPIAKSSPCCGCGKVLDAATPVDQSDGEHDPTPGSYTVCAYCATLMVYDQDLSLRSLSPEELADMPLDLRVQIQRVRYVIAQQMARRRTKSEEAH